MASKTRSQSIRKESVNVTGEKNRWDKKVDAMNKKDVQAARQNKLHPYGSTAEDAMYVGGTRTKPASQRTRQSDNHWRGHMQGYGEALKDNNQRNQQDKEKEGTVRRTRQMMEEAFNKKRKK